MEGIENSDSKKDSERGEMRLDLTGDTPSVREGDRRREATAAEIREAAQQKVGAPPSEGMPRFVFVTTDDSTVPSESLASEPLPAESRTNSTKPPEPPPTASHEESARGDEGSEQGAVGNPPQANTSRVYGLGTDGVTDEGTVTEIPLPTRVDDSWQKVPPRDIPVSESHAASEAVPAHDVPPGQGEGSERVNPDRPGRIAGLGSRTEGPMPADRRKVGLGEFRREDYQGIIPFAIPEIMQNAERQTLWGEFIDAVKPGEGRDIITKAAETGVLSEAERQFIDHAQHEFTKVIKDWEELKKGITPEFVKSHLIQRDDKLRSFVDLAGENGVVAAFQRHYIRDAIKTMGSSAGRDKFHGYAQHLRTIHDMSEKPVYKEYETKIRALCKQFNIDTKDPEHETLLEKYLGFGLPKRKESARGDDAIQELRDKYREDLTTFRRIKDDIRGLVGAGTKSEARGTYNEAVELYRAKTRGEMLGDLKGKPLQDINRSLNAVTVFLADTISPHASELTRLSFTAESAPQPAFLPTVQQVFGEGGAFSPENIQKSFNTAREKATITTGGATKKWQTFTEPEKAEFRDSWIESQKQDTLRRLEGGNWFVALLFKLLLGSKLDERARGLQLDGSQQNRPQQQNRDRGGRE